MPGRDIDYVDVAATPVWNVPLPSAGGHMAAVTEAGADERAYRQHLRPVMAMLATRYSELDPDGRLELYQEAWTSVLQRRNEGIQVDSLKAYLMGAADKLASKRVYGADARRRQTFDPSGPRFATLPDAGEQPDELVLAADEARRVHMFIEELDVAERALLKLRLEHGLDPPEIRERLGLTDRQYRRTAERAGRALQAQFVALGGTSYAVATIGTKQIKNNSVRGVDVRNGTLTSRDVKRGSLGGRAIKESALATVPRANRVGSKTATQLTLRCPAGTAANMDSCIETSPRPALAYGLARVACEFARRRLPSHQELVSFTDNEPGTLAPGGELTSNVLPPQSASEQVRVLIVVTSAGSVDTVPNTFAGGKGFRCVANPING